jgi:hypothetical protein
MLLSAVSVLVVAQPKPSSEVSEGLTNYPVYILGGTSMEDKVGKL